MIECSGCIQTSGVCEPKFIPGGLHTTVVRPVFVCVHFFQCGFNFSLISMRFDALKPELMLATAMNSLSAKNKEKKKAIKCFPFRLMWMDYSKEKFSSVLRPSICKRICWICCSIRR